MKRLLPGRFELALFSAMALISGVLVTFSGHRDTMIFVLTLPIFFVASLLGFRRKLILQQVDNSPNIQVNSDTESQR